MNFKKLKKSLVAVAFALSFCFSSIVNVVSALGAQYYTDTVNQLVGNQDALDNLELIREWHASYQDAERGFVVGKIQSRFQTFKRELTLPECTWQDEIHNLRLLGETLIFAVKPLEENQENFTNTMFDLCRRLTTDEINDLINDWDDEMYFQFTKYR